MFSIISMNFINISLFSFQKLVVLFLSLWLIKVAILNALPTTLQQSLMNSPYTDKCSTTDESVVNKFPDIKEYLFNPSVALESTTSFGRKRLRRRSYDQNNVRGKYSKDAFLALRENNEESLQIKKNNYYGLRTLSETDLFQVELEYGTFHRVVMKCIFSNETRISTDTNIHQDKDSQKSFYDRNAFIEEESKIISERGNNWRKIIKCSFPLERHGYDENASQKDEEIYKQSNAFSLEDFYNMRLEKGKDDRKIIRCILSNKSQTTHAFQERHAADSLSENQSNYGFTTEKTSFKIKISKRDNSLGSSRCILKNETETRDYLITTRQENFVNSERGDYRSNSQPPELRRISFSHIQTVTYSNDIRSNKQISTLNNEVTPMMENGFSSGRDDFNLELSPSQEQAEIKTAERNQKTDIADIVLIISVHGRKDLKNVIRKFKPKNITEDLEKTFNIKGRSNVQKYFGKNSKGSSGSEEKKNGDFFIYLPGCKSRSPIPKKRIVMLYDNEGNKIIVKLRFIPKKCTYVVKIKLDSLRRTKHLNAKVNKCKFRIMQLKNRSAILKYNPTDCKYGSLFYGSQNSKIFLYFTDRARSRIVGNHIGKQNNNKKKRVNEEPRFFPENCSPLVEIKPHSLRHSKHFHVKKMKFCILLSNETKSRRKHEDIQINKSQNKKYIYKSTSSSRKYSAFSRSNNLNTTLATFLQVRYRKSFINSVKESRISMSKQNSSVPKDPVKYIGHFVQPPKQKKDRENKLLNKKNNKNSSESTDSAKIGDLVLSQNIDKGYPFNQLHGKSHYNQKFPSGSQSQTDETIKIQTDDQVEKYQNQE